MREMKGMEKVEFKILLWDTKTKHQNWFTEERAGPLNEAIHNAEFMWNEGNWSCDCNRSFFLWGWRADDEPVHELPCNTGKNRIVIVKCLVDGKPMNIGLTDESSEEDGKG